MDKIMRPPAGKETSKRGGKKKNFVPLLDFDSNILIPGRHPCDCEASAHKLVNNCLSCGRIICEQERVGECFTCGEFINDKEIERQNEIAAASVAAYLNSSQQGKENEKKKKNEKNKREGIRNIAASLEKAVQHKNKLLEYDRTCQQRTRVIDDESDYFKLTSQHWLSQEKRGEIEAKIDQLQEKKFAKDRTLTLDIVEARFEENVTPVIANVGKVVQELDDDTAFKSDYQIVDSKSLNINEKLPRANYCAQEKKKEVDTKSKQVKRDKSKIESSTASASNSTTLRTSIFNNNLLRLQDPELMGMSDSGVCLTIQQPWASFIISGIKLHEGRSWYTHYRGRIWIHASGRPATQDEINDAKKIFSLITKDYTKFPIDYPGSLLLGCATLKDCLPQEEYRQSVENPYMESTYVWILEGPMQLKVKIPMNSKSNRLFNLDDQILKAASKQLDFSF